MIRQPSPSHIRSYAIEWPTDYGRAHGEVASVRVVCACGQGYITHQKPGFTLLELAKDKTKDCHEHDHDLRGRREV